MTTNMTPTEFKRAYGYIISTIDDIREEKQKHLGNLSNVRNDKFLHKNWIRKAGTLNKEMDNYKKELADLIYEHPEHLV